MAITEFGNLALKVSDLDSAIEFFERTGLEVTGRAEWQNGERADVMLGSVCLTLFTRAIYEDEVLLPEDGFLHVALFSDDLNAQLQGHDIVWGPKVVSGPFGTRRIAFVNAPGDTRLEFMEKLDEPARSSRS